MLYGGVAVQPGQHSILQSGGECGLSSLEEYTIPQYNIPQPVSSSTQAESSQKYRNVFNMDGGQVTLLFDGVELLARAEWYAVSCQTVQQQKTYIKVHLANQ